MEYYCEVWRIDGKGKKGKMERQSDDFLIFIHSNQYKYLMKKGQPAKGKQPPAPKAFNPDDFVTMTLPRE